MTAGGSETPWETAQTVAAVFAVSPEGLGGVDLAAFPGPVRDSWIEYLSGLTPDQPVRQIPLNVTESRLLGSLDVAATLRTGKPQHSSGLLAECDGRIVQLNMAERVEARVIAHLCAALDNGWVATPGEPVAASFGVIAMNEGLEDEGLPDPLIDRLAFRLGLGSLGLGDITGGGFSAADIADARHRLHGVSCPDAFVETACALSLLLGVDSTRAWQHTVLSARILAALRRASLVEEADVMRASQLVMGHRATRLPQAEQAEQPETPPESDTAPESPGDEEPPAEQDSSTPPEDQLIEAATAAIPADLLRQLAAGARRQKGRNHTGRSGASQQSSQRGRPIGARRGDPRRGGRLDVLSTLRAAVPWQGLRKTPDNSDAGTTPAIVIHKDDFRVVRYKHRAESTTIFVVDASGSSALHRLGEAKGAIERLLADCYSRRDSVALIAFRGERAELLLPPTRSLVRVKRSLAALPGGGGTPLASAIELCGQLVDQTHRAGATPGIVMLTDGVANIARDGSRGRETATEDALKAARVLAQTEVASLLIDTSPRPQTRAQTLAQALDAHYFALPHADSQRLYNVIRDHAGRA